MRAIFSLFSLSFPHFCPSFVPQRGFGGQNSVPRHILDTYNFKSGKNLESFHFSKLLESLSGNIHQYITTLIYNTLQFKHITTEVTASGILFGILQKHNLNICRHLLQSKDSPQTTNFLLSHMVVDSYIESDNAGN